MTKEHLLGQAQRGVLLYTVPSSLCHGSGRLRQRLAQLRVAQSPSRSVLLETDNLGRENKRASTCRFSSLQPLDSWMGCPQAGLSGVAVVTLWMEQGNPIWQLWERSFTSCEALVVHHLRDKQLSSKSHISKGKIIIF